MTVLSSTSLSADTIKVRWGEPYISSGINQKTLGLQPKGVFAGFNVVPGVAPFGISVAVDSSLGFSGANILETTGGTYCVSIIQPSNVAIDLASFFSQTVYIALDAQYSPTVATTAQIKVVNAAELTSNLDLVLLAKVNVPGSGPILSSHINTGYRLLAGDSITSESRPTVNLLAHGTFERDTASGDPSGWLSSGAGLVLSVDGAISHSGIQSLKLVASGAVSLVATSLLVVVSPGQKYRVGCWIRSTGGSPIAGGDGVRIQVDWFNAAGTPLSTTSIEDAASSPLGFTGGGTTFVERKSEVTAPAGASTAKLKINYDNCSGTLYFDDGEFSTRRVEVPPLDGDPAFLGIANTFTAQNTFTPSGAGTAVTATGNTAGGGVLGTGGATGGIGVRGNGGATSGVGILGSGGAPNGIGVSGFGAGTSSGVEGLGGGTGGTGISGTGGGTGGTGVVGIGGSTSGFGVVGFGIGGSDGIRGFGGATSGTGVHGIGGAPNGHGAVFAGAGTGAAVDASSDNIINVANPVNAQDAATKVYVDNSRSGNLALNGRFDFWQRGTTFSSTALLAPGVGGVYAYTRLFSADRWYAFQIAQDTATDSPALTYSQVATVTGAEQYPWAARLQRDGGETATGVIGLAQEVDRGFVKLNRGNTLQVTALVRTGADFTGGLAVGIFTGSGTSEGEEIHDPTSTVSTGGYTGTFTTLVNATVGTGTPGASSVTTALTVTTSVVPLTATNMALLFRRTGMTGTAGANDWIDITGVQLTKGIAGTTIAIPYTLAGITLAGELDACQRYYEKSYDITVDPGTPGGAALFGYESAFSVTGDGSPFLHHGVRYKTRKRSNPAIQVYAPTSGTGAKWQNAGLTPGDVTMTITAIGETGFRVYETSIGDGAIFWGHWTADAEI